MREAAAQAVPQELSRFVSRLLACCLNIREIWLIGLGNRASPGRARWELLAFADASTLQRLRKAGDLHREDVDVLVVTDGDRLENAWGAHRLPGSLGRWTWRQAGGGDAFYDESTWAGAREKGEVVRLRRKAVRLWQSSG